MVRSLCKWVSVGRSLGSCWHAGSAIAHPSTPMTSSTHVHDGIPPCGDFYAPDGNRHPMTCARLNLAPYLRLDRRHVVGGCGPPLQAYVGPHVPEDWRRREGRAASWASGVSVTHNDPTCASTASGAGDQSGRGSVVYRAMLDLAVRQRHLWDPLKIRSFVHLYQLVVLAHEDRDGVVDPHHHWVGHGGDGRGSLAKSM